MAKIIQSIRGVKDYLINETFVLQKIEKYLKKILLSYGYNEIRLPILENTFLFKHAIGEITDVVQKEMFTFKNKKNKSLTLRPEGTAGCIRAGIQHSFFYNQEQKIWYIGPMFRYERPQMGRYRQFYQLGVEVFGFPGPNIDAELILINSKFWKSLKIIDHVTLQINSIGSINTRIKYRNKLILFLEKNKKILDEDCKVKLYKNPLRILDSKNPDIQKLLKHAPQIHDYIDDNSYKHFSNLCNMLNKLGISYQINKNLVRGLDYYNNTVFEWITNKIGAQSTVCAGGRYDGLVSRLGGPDIPSIGFAIGIDRLLLLLNKKYNLKNNIDLYVFISSYDIEIDVTLMIENLRNKWKDLKIVIHHKIINCKKFFNTAIKKNANFFLFIQKNDLNKDFFLLNNINTKKKFYVTKSELIQKLPKLLKNE